MASHLGSEQIKQLLENTNIQNGDRRDNTDLPLGRGVGDLHRLQRRVLPYPNKRSIPEVHAFSYPRQDLSIQTGTFGQITYENHTVASQKQLENPRNVGEDHSHSKITPPTSELVAGGKQCYHRSTTTPLSHALQILTDASKEVWGAHLNEHLTRGSWSLPESKLHINYLELKAVLLALKEFQALCTSKVVLIATDNTTVVAYINKEGGMESGPLCALLWRIMTWCTRYQVNLKARHIPGCLNVMADKLSRLGQTIQMEWSLNLEVFQAICKFLHIIHVLKLFLFYTLKFSGQFSMPVS